VDPRTNHRSHEVLPKAAGRAQEPQEPAQRAAAIGDGGSRKAAKQVVDEHVDVADANRRNRAPAGP